MANNINGLDHAVIAVRDLTIADAAFHRLGFTLTPRGEHPEWGTANHCIMFRQDYIALQAAVGAGEVADELRAFTDAHEGLHGISLGTDNGAAVIERLQSLGLDVPLPRSLSRRIDTDQGQATLMFSETLLPMEATPGIHTRVTQHITAERERFPDWLVHPNGAIGIASVTAIVAEPVELTAAWDLVLGPHRAVITDDTVTLHTGRGLIFLSKPDDLTQLHPEAELDELPPAPALVALAVLVADTDRAAQWLTHNDVEFSRDREGTIRIPPSEACGVHLEMVKG
ncbi:VOC family protein [Magnetospirillum sulfuroxidans]|uniref:VOC family protein n=1 Tax=Magnetospirillum sulfuroxidans TaxID=611300 RepID=A0ABS5IAD0_9PROT|nr:VOC family protein [Magnetospirillum sulfuroxidans]MBR9971381.1 VOC family protein [Magnetospirillum sulfuroxidans]